MATTISASIAVCGAGISLKPSNASVWRSNFVSSNGFVRVATKASAAHSRAVFENFNHLSVSGSRTSSVVALASESLAEAAEPGELAQGAEAAAEGIEALPLQSDVDKRLARRAELRRKRLVRKRHLRKKGRWPPAKMAKTKNV